MPTYISLKCLPPRTGSSCNSAVFKFFRFAEQFFAVAVQVFSGFSQRKAARAAHQKLYPQFFFQRQYLLGYCRLRYKTFFGRFCKAAGVHYGYKIFNLPQQHKPPLLSQELYFYCKVLILLSVKPLRKFFINFSYFCYKAMPCRIKACFLVIYYHI